MAELMDMREPEIKIAVSMFASVACKPMVLLMISLVIKINGR